MTALVLLGNLCTLGRAHALPDFDWPRLARVHTIAWVNPFFEASVAAGFPEKASSPITSDERRKLTITLQSAMLRRLHTQSRYVLVPQERVENALHGMRWTARDLLKNRGVVRGRDWPVPDRDRLIKFSRRVGADAVVVGILYDPASIGEGLQLQHELFSPKILNLNVRPTRRHVISPRARLVLVTNQGAVAWRDEQMADHPRTNPRTRHTLLLDWTESTEQLAEQLADSLLRMPPENAGHLKSRDDEPTRNRTSPPSARPKGSRVKAPPLG